MKLEPFYGTYQPSAHVADGGRAQLFLGARAVEKVDKRLVAYGGDGKLRSVQYDKLGVLDLAAIQALQKELAAQQAEIASLRATLKANGLQ